MHQRRRGLTARRRHGRRVGQSLWSSLQEFGSAPPAAVDSPPPQSDIEWCRHACAGLMEASRRTRLTDHEVLDRIGRDVALEREPASVDHVRLPSLWPLGIGVRSTAAGTSIGFGGLSLPAHRAPQPNDLGALPVQPSRC